MAGTKQYLLSVCLLLVLSCYQAQKTLNANEVKEPLTEKQKAIVLILTFTTKGDLVKLKQALNGALMQFVLIEKSVSKSDADAARKVFSEMLSRN